MKILFTHRVFPGQFRNLIARLTKDQRNQIKFLAFQLHEAPDPALDVIRYQPARKAGESTHPCVMSTEDAVLFGQAAYRAALRLKEQGFYPDVIFGHSGWGPTLYLRDLFPRAKFLAYFEWFYRARGSSHGFHPNIPLTPEFEQQIRTKNVPILMDLAAAQAGVWSRRLLSAGAVIVPHSNHRNPMPRLRAAPQNGQASGAVAVVITRPPVARGDYRASFRCSCFEDASEGGPSRHRHC